MIPYILNLIILLIILYRIFIGVEGGLFNEFINLINFLFSAGMSFILFRTLSPYVYKYILPNEDYALFIALWILFVLFISALWSIKQVFFSKIYSMTREKTIHLLTPIDKIGGAICGIIFALYLMSFIIVSLYIAPGTKSLYTLHERDKIIFKTDELWLKKYSGFTGFDWEEFLNTLKPKQIEESQEEISQEETKQE